MARGAALLAALAVVLADCGSATQVGARVADATASPTDVAHATASPTEAPDLMKGLRPATVANEYVVYDMTGPKTGPPEASDPVSDARYVSDGLQITMKAPRNNTRFGWRLPAISKGIHVEMDVRFGTKLDSTTDLLPYAGPICVSEQPGARTLPRYVVAINPLGDVFVVRVTPDNEFTRLGIATTPAVSALGTNHIVGDCFTQDGSSEVVAVSVNGTKALQVVDADPKRLVINSAAGIEVVSGAQAPFVFIVRGFRAGPIVAAN